MLENSKETVEEGREKERIREEEKEGKEKGGGIGGGGNFNKWESFNCIIEGIKPQIKFIMPSQTEKQAQSDATNTEEPPFGKKLHFNINL